MGAVAPLIFDTSYHTTRQPFIMSLRIHLDRYCQLRAMSHERISPTKTVRWKLYEFTELDGLQHVYNPSITCL